MDNDKLIEYCMYVNYLRILLNKGLITLEEYEKVLSKIKKDLDIISNIMC